MASVQCRPDVNALTVPQSYKLRYVPRDSMGTDGLAAAMAAENPNYSVEDNKTMLANLVRVLQKNLLNGTQSTIDGAFTFGISFTGRLDSPDARCRRWRKSCMLMSTSSPPSSRKSGSRLRSNGWP